MKQQLRNYVTSALLLLPVAASLMALPTVAVAQPATPEVDSLDIAADAGLEPGSRLSFRLVGTPRVQASVRIRGIRETIALRETTPGVYGGRYTLKRADRIAPDSEVRAVLRRGKRVGASEYELSETMGPAPRVAAPPPAPVRAPDPRIERFGMAPIDRIEPGAELRFVLDGIPGATVIVDIPGVANDVELRETRPGHYEGGYTIRRADSFNPNRPFVATMRLGDRVITANMALAVTPPVPPVAAPDNTPPLLVNIRPREGETVPSGAPVQISANFDDRGGSGVDPASVRIVLSGRNITPESQVNRQSFTFRAVLPPGRHSVEVNARDMAGNALRTGWSFDVAAAAPVNVPIQIINHGQNGQVGSGPTLVQGRTSPNASVVVSVNAVAPVGGVLNISQELFSQTLQADGNGNFSFTFVPQFPIPGTRYDITMVSTRGNYRDDAKLSLFQR